jgi:SagB-type dehydrogenase family enzyme
MDRLIKISFVSTVLLSFLWLNLFAEETINGNNIILPKPNISSKITLQSVLLNRKSTREFSNKELSKQTLSNLLWAAFGVNRKDGRRTAPSAKNAQDITIYIAMKDGVYKYASVQNQLDLVIKEDIRGKVGYQPFLKDAPVILIYVSDLSKFGKMSESDKTFYSAADTGFISQNVYLYCTGEKLGTVVAGWVKRDDVFKILKLNKEEKVILIQPVGYPK